MVSLSSIEYNNEVKQIHLIELDKEIDKYKKLQKEVIEDYKNNFISKGDFENFNENYLYKLNNLKLEKEQLENSSSNTDFNLDWINKIKVDEKIKTLSKSIIDEYIDTIYIDENKNIKIKFRFKDEYENVLRYLNSH